jgi:hypothetical protein
MLVIRSIKGEIRLVEVCLLTAQSKVSCKPRPRQWNRETSDPLCESVLCKQA